MRIIVATSNKYAHLVQGFADNFNEQWPYPDVVDVLGYEEPIEGLPLNFIVHNLGVQEKYKDKWTTALRPWILENVLEPHFVLFLEDYWLTEVDDKALSYAESIMEQGMCEKFDLTQDRTHFPNKVEPITGLVVSDQMARYRTSLQAAIWNTGYFLKYCKPNRTAWEFELIGEKEAMNDGASIVGTVNGIVKYDNIMLKGELK